MSPRIRSAISVAGVLALSGVLFTASAQLAGDQDTRHRDDLASVIAAESARVEELSEQANLLDDEVDQLGDAVDVDVPRRDPALRAQEAVVSGAWPVAGGGLSVALEDAPISALDNPQVRPDDLVVHQQDVQHVINALWAGGAEAMTLQGERVTSTSAFRCSGNILLLHGKVFSPPYVIEAIGDPDQLQAALDASPGIGVYKQYVDWIGLGYDVQQHDGLEMPAYTGGEGLQHATVPEGTDVFS
ncbi:uncharacterized protein YlxW (UPF0749 family) [Isoptericola sp. CG 20/1183]|uniref:Uncharacterized protein YlxW (UPF0749 family) n=1 Tax=Isoptericola halotolerans TaxID=300560 RepID=A0ABX5EKV5_9MICO|nr:MULTISPECIES: DUF881 domain-containing protein [Isoptericola]MCK0116040.1 DUF881 domain-containing protein [Isoptericola sp. S6320L]PRZ08781.1 uncharacterized protein YlxW (UPF0749 family) [Isoptericola halotolerans]PRZ10772.1 uncharacterized protein YlxW (UPF0749 family) [Isoptericola sp. CG 20/1183]